MDINNIGSRAAADMSQGIGSTAAKKDVAADSAPNKPNAVSDSSDKTSVTVSSRALMLSRLFGGHAGDAEPPVLSGINGMDENHIGIAPVNFLNEQDRALVSDMYSYAQQEGIALANVDSLAITLGEYRQSNNGKVMVNSNNGTMFDLEGHQLTFNFNAQESESAQRLRNSDALNSTRLDSGFIQYATDPGFGALSNGMDMRFLEKMATVFSGGDQSKAPPSSLFASELTRNVSVSAVITASKEVVLKLAEPDIENIDGRWIVHNPEALKASASGSPSASQRSDAKLRINQMIIDTFLSKTASSLSDLAPATIRNPNSVGK